MAFLRRSGVKNRFLITGSTETESEKSNYSNKALCILRIICFWLNIQVLSDVVVIGGLWDNIMKMFCSRLTDKSDDKASRIQISSIFYSFGPYSFKLGRSFSSQLKRFKRFRCSFAIMGFSIHAWVSATFCSCNQR
jgi:hypothetical protein